MDYPANVEQMLDADIVAVAAVAFVATFTGVRLGSDTASSKVLKSVKAQFGNPRWIDVTIPAYNAVVLEIELVFEQARVAARSSTGRLLLLPRGVRLLAAPDPVAALRELL